MGEQTRFAVQLWGYIEPGYCFSSPSQLRREMGRKPCCSKEGLNRGAWTAMEDEALRSYIKAHGEGLWRNLPKRAGLKRCGKSCRLRWLNYLRPDIKRGNISEDEEELIIRLHRLLGNRWSLIAGRLPGRTDNEIKNYWNTSLRKKLKPQSPSSSPLTPPPKKTRAAKKHPPKTSIVDHSSPAGPNRVIVTRATRCTRVVFPIPCPPTIDSSNSATSELQPFSTDSDDSNGGSEKEMEIPERNMNTLELQGSSSGADGEGNDYMNEFYVDPDQRLSLQEPIFTDWMFNYTVPEENPCLNLDSFDFLLDPQEWP